MCNCNEKPTPCNPCTQPPCSPPENCDCPIKDLKSDCIIVTKDLTCTNVESGQTLTETLVQLDQGVCDKFNQLSQSINLVSTGTGEDIYNGIDGIGRRKIRRIKEGGNLIDIVANTDDISVGVNEINLTTFIQTNQKTYSQTNVGTGVEIYKDSTVSGNNTQFNLRSIKVDNQLGIGVTPIRDIIQNTNDITIRGKKITSSSLNVTEDTQNILIELPSSDIPEFIVNSSYTGLIESGSQSQPFKTIENALIAYVGSGTNKNPQNSGALIRIKKGIGYTFTGVFAHKELKVVVEEGVDILSNPIVGDYISDLDVDANLPSPMITFTDTESLSMYITLNEGSKIRLSKNGFKNRGTNTNTNSSLGKAVFLMGRGEVITENDTNILIPSIRTIIESNIDNRIGYFNDGNTGHFYIDCKLTSHNTGIISAGLNSTITLREGVILQFGTTNTQKNPTTVPFKFSGSLLYVNSTSFINYKHPADLQTDSIFIISNSSFIEILNSTFFGNNVNKYFNLSTNNNITINSSNHTVVSTVLFESPVISSVKLYNNFIVSGIDYTKIVIVAPTYNLINSQIVETLNKYSNKTTAIAAGLFKGCKYIKRVTVNSNALIVGEDYEIKTIGDADFILAGATTNTIGTIFTAINTGNGTTGQVYFDTLDIV